MPKLLPLAAFLLIALPSVSRAQAPAAAPEALQSPEYQALQAKEDAAMAALDKKDGDELVEKLKEPKYAGEKGKKALEKLIKKHAAAEAKLAAKEAREKESYLDAHAPKAELAKGKK